MFRHMKKLLYLSLLAAVILAACEAQQEQAGQDRLRPCSLRLCHVRGLIGSDVLGFYRLTVDFKTCELR